MPKCEKIIHPKDIMSRDITTMGKIGTIAPFFIKMKKAEGSCNPFCL